MPNASATDPTAEERLASYLNHPRRPDIIERALAVPAVLRNAPQRIRCPRRATQRMAELRQDYLLDAARLRGAGRTAEAEQAQRIANAADRLMQRYSRQTDDQPQREGMAS